MTLATPIDMLEAVNIMLEGASEQGVNTLVDDGTNDSSVAQGILNRTIIKIFSKGWDFNTVTRTMSPNDSSNIIITTNYLRIDGAGSDYGRRFTVRDNLLFDLDDNTNVFEKDVELCITQNLEFTDAPLELRYFIAHSAARTYQMKANGDPEADAILAIEEAQAWEDVKKNDSKTRDATWISRSRDPQQVFSIRNTRYRR